MTFFVCHRISIWCWCYTSLLSLLYQAQIFINCSDVFWYVAHIFSWKQTCLQSWTRPSSMGAARISSLRPVFSLPMMCFINAEESLDEEGDETESVPRVCIMKVCIWWFVLMVCIGIMVHMSITKFWFMGWPSTCQEKLGPDITLTQTRCTHQTWKVRWPSGNYSGWTWNSGIKL